MKRNDKRAARIVLLQRPRAYVESLADADPEKGAATIQGLLSRLRHGAV